ncbi:TetR family transcriptional regulator [Streptomyces sp. B-S-A8]|uniref:TetR family transcriptional regulator n=1 Tax=Streptomyces solicavernae TaxID=3043614 RepID=A0ABT6RZW7_9ACTN|nr:TetR/AcrR family transcriptional regulator [Streptomyces sp. B-S-A8]MDI3389976.1 TetR family transcriptional regulator [Streptomyces sp. B-S-A8]
MVKQERALLTRDRMVRAAADAFARQGYTGTSLQDVCRGAGVSMGALTFHFARKRDLAAAVTEVGTETTRQAIDRVLHATDDPLQSVVAVTCELADLLASDAGVQATRQLAEPAADWDDIWMPTVRLLLFEAEQQQLLDSAVKVETLVRLASHLVHGSASSLRGTEQGEHRATELSRIWAAVIHGITAPTVRAMRRRREPERA